MKTLSNQELIKGIQAGDKRLLGKAITLVESKKVEHRAQAFKTTFAFYWEISQNWHYWSSRGWKIYVHRKFWKTGHSARKKSCRFGY